jgi:anti-anti-sigma factor
MTDIRPRISIKYHDSATIVTFDDNKILEETDIKAIQQSLIPIAEQAEQMCLILDFANVGFLSSAVLGLLIRISKKIYENGGRLKLCNISPKIYEVFKITRLTKTFDIYRDVECAIEALETEPAD